jgi:hypothetical protein
MRRRIITAVSTELPPCGLYRTIKPIGNVDAGRLVYFHNHGDPGPGLYFPESWTGNRAKFSQNGSVVPANFDPKSLQALPVEGFYRVKAAFHCCEKKCVKFEPDAFVQLGYNGNAKPLLFVPELAGASIQIPERGTAIDDQALEHLVLLKMAERQGNASDPHGGGGGGGGIDIKMPRVVIH